MRIKASRTELALSNYGHYCLFVTMITESEGTENDMAAIAINGPHLDFLRINGSTIRSRRRKGIPGPHSELKLRTESIVQEKLK